MNLPNKLTLTRLLVIPVFLFFLLAKFYPPQTFGNLLFLFISLILYIAAMITDIYDGVIARRLNMVTNFGKLFDPLADKILNCSTFVALMSLNLVPEWIVIVILAREFLVTGLRSLAANQNRIIAADNWGKTKTTSQVVSIIYGIILLILRDILYIDPFHWGMPTASLIDQWITWGFQLTLYFCAFMALVSGYAYLAKNWDLITDKEPEKK